MGGDILATLPFGWAHRGTLSTASIKSSEDHKVRYNCPHGGHMSCSPAVDFFLKVASSDSEETAFSFHSVSDVLQKGESYQGFWPCPFPQFLLKLPGLCPSGKPIFDHCSCSVSETTHVIMPQCTCGEVKGHFAGVSSSLLPCRF